MFQDVFNYKPKEQDYRIWLVLNPAVWLVPILAAVLVIALASTMVFSLDEYKWSAEKLRSTCCSTCTSHRPLSKHYHRDCHSCADQMRCSQSPPASQQP